MYVLNFDLKRLHDPYLRLGLLGLFSACKHVRDPRRKHLYSRVPSEDLLKWEIDEDAGTITLYYAGAEILEQFSDAIWGDFKQGFTVPPGFSDDLSDDRIYSTALAHEGLTSMFIDGHHASRRRATCVGKASQEQFKKDHPEVDFVLKLGSAVKNKKVAEGNEPETLCLWARPYTTLDTKKPRPVVGFGVKEGEELSGTTLFSANVYHPACGIWNDHKAKMERTDLFLLSFAGLAYAFVKGAHTVALGLDLPSFKEFEKAHEEYREAFLGDTSCVYMTQVEPVVAAGVLAKLIGLPRNRTYPYSYAVWGKKGVDKILHGNLFFNEKAGNLATILWETGKAVAGMSKSRAERVIWQMRRAILVSYNDEKVRTIYAQVWGNQASGNPWYAGFQVLSSRKQEDGQIGNLLASLSSQLEDDMERQIGEAVRTMRYCIVKQLQKKGWSNMHEAYAYALEFMVKVNLRGVTNRTTLDAALSRIMVKAGFGFTKEQSEYIDAHDPRHMASLLVMALYERHPKKVEDGTPVAGAPEEVPDSPDSELDENVNEVAL